MNERVERGDITVRAGIDTAWAVCTDFSAFPEFIPGLSSCTLREDGSWDWVGRAFGMSRSWRSWELERDEQPATRRLAWRTDDPMVPDGEVIVDEPHPGRARVRIEMRYAPVTLLDRALVNQTFARVRLRLDLRHFRRRAERFAANA